MKRIPNGLAASLSILFFGLAITASFAIGAKVINPADVFQALFFGHADEGIQAVVGARVSRTAAGIFTGAALGCAGALMQGATRNPLADPGLLGINAGAVFGLVVSLTFGFSYGSYPTMTATSLGALLAVLIVQTIGSIGVGGPTPVKLVLAGAAISAGLTAVSQGMLLSDDFVYDIFRYWAVGSINTTTLDPVMTVAPAIIVGLILAFTISGKLNTIAMGDDVAKGLGVRIWLVRTVAIISVALTCGAAVSLSGPIGFIGLVVPHALRLFFGNDYRWLIPLSIVASPTAILFLDVIGRVILPPSEIQAGTSTAILGAPIFLLLLKTNLKKVE